MPKASTRLSYILLRLGIRTGQIAAHTGIDKSLISRWRGGERRLSPGSEYSRKIVEYIISKDTAESIIEKTLMAYGLDASTGSLADNLDFWLSEQDLPLPSLAKKPLAASSYTASFSVFTGPNNIQNALISFYDYVISREAASNILIVALDDTQSLVESPDFVEMFMDRVVTASKWGIRTTLIYRGNYPRGLTATAPRWAEAVLSGFLSILRYENSEDFTDSRLVASAKDMISLRMNQDQSGATPVVYTSSFTETLTVRHIYGVCERYLALSKPVVTPGFFSSPGTLLQARQTEAILTSNAFVCARVPFFASIPFRELSQHTRMSVSATNAKLRPLEPLFHLPSEYAPTVRLRHVYCIDSIEAVLRPSRVQNPVLSAVFDKNINYSRKLLLHQLSQLALMMKRQENFELALLPQKFFDNLPISMVGVQGQFFVAWLANGTQSAYFPWHNSLMDMADFFDMLWSSIPAQNRDRDANLRLLNRVIRRASADKKQKTGRQ